ncbi:hypothetical protein [Chromohalobacter israelensis]|uniref:hypothetical protein n=1 Tax=Chromohalobacter israelensis TaxID=141390 RepID=UPI0015C414E1|nr:hypothetical protein [Chromohalobacter salexigens]NWO55022.1 hypothetical protein [Chromohalobacter salexigens]
MTHRMTTQAAQPLGTLQDAGELAVLTPNEEPVRHRYAMVVAFSSEEELRRAVQEHRCAYRDGHTVQTLNAEDVAHGR